jgi:DNA repair exonuclease SbcCD ATPase subunit
LSDANKRDVEYKNKIEALKKNLSISPDQTDRFYSDQNAVYQVLKRELDAVTKTMESERKYMESLRQLEMERLKDLEKHRQVLQNHLGNSPAEMTSRVSRENMTDPNAVRLRSELDNLKLAHQRSKHQFEERERDLNHKLKVLQSDYTKLMDQLLEKERQGEALQKSAEKLSAAEHELLELRKSYDAERKQFVANNNALAARIVELEGGVRGGRPEEVQSAEARGVKLASWMSFKK